MERRPAGRRRVRCSVELVPVWDRLVRDAELASDPTPWSDALLEEVHSAHAPRIHAQEVTPAPDWFRACYRRPWGVVSGVWHARIFPHVAPSSGVLLENRYSDRWPMAVRGSDW